MKIAQEKLDTVINQALGSRILDEEGNSFTFRSLLVTVANFAKDKDSIPDSMRLFRLQEKLIGKKGDIVLTETDVDDLKDRGETKLKKSPWLTGKLFVLLEDKPSLELLDRTEAKEK